MSMGDVPIRGPLSDYLSEKDGEPPTGTALDDFLATVSRRIADLPFQLYLRYLDPVEDKVTAEYANHIARYGGGCADKSLLLNMILQRQGYTTEYVLGGFGANDRISSQKLSKTLNESPDEEAIPHTYHAAVLVLDGNRRLLVEASGGRVGSFVFSSEETEALLAQETMLSCPNIDEPLYYHRFSQAETKEVLRNKLQNDALLPKMIYRVGVAVAGRWTCYLCPSMFDFTDQRCSDVPEETRTGLTSDELLKHPIAMSLGRDGLALLRATVSTVAGSSGCADHIHLHRAQKPWGVNSELL